MASLLGTEVAVCVLHIGAGTPTTGTEVASMCSSSEGRAATGRTSNRWGLGRAGGGHRGPPGEVAAPHARHATVGQVAAEQ